MFHDKQVLPAVAKAVATQVRHGEKWLRLEQKIGWEVWISLDLITPKVLFKRESKNCVIDMEAIAIRLEAIATRNKKKGIVNWSVWVCPPLHKETRPGQHPDGTLW